MGNKNRKLVSVQKIAEIKPIRNADKIEVAVVLGWNVVVKKDMFQVGDKVAYFEIDSFLPIKPEYEFLRNSSYKKDALGTEGFRLRTAELRGVISQGLILPLDEQYKSLDIGTDLTKEFGVILYEPPVDLSGGEKIALKFHSRISKTDELRAQSAPELLEALIGKPYYISEKIDGQSLTLVKEGNNIRVFFRDSEVLESEESFVWNRLNELGIINMLKNSPEDIFIQGEWYGERIQKNRLKVKGIHYKFFNLGEPKTGKVYSYTEWNDILNRIDPNGVLKHVKIIEEGDSFDYTLEELQDLSKGNYEGAGQREGIVIRPQNEESVKGLGRLSFKVINNKYLLKHGE